MPDLETFADVQADVALNPERFRALFGDKIPQHPANILVFADLHTSNATFRVARELGNATAIGPMLTMLLEGGSCPPPSIPSPGNPDFNGDGCADLCSPKSPRRGRHMRENLCQNM